MCSSQCSAEVAPPIVASMLDSLAGLPSTSCGRCQVLHQSCRDSSTTARYLSAGGDVLDGAQYFLHPGFRQELQHKFREQRIPTPEPGRQRRSHACAVSSSLPAMRVILATNSDYMRVHVSRSWAASIQSSSAPRKLRLEPGAYRPNNVSLGVDAPDTDVTGLSLGRYVEALDASSASTLPSREAQFLPGIVWARAGLSAPRVLPTSTTAAQSPLPMLALWPGPRGCGPSALSA